MIRKIILSAFIFYLIGWVFVLLRKILIDDEPRVMLSIILGDKNLSNGVRGLTTVFFWIIYPYIAIFISIFGGFKILCKSIKTVLEVFKEWR